MHHRSLLGRLSDSFAEYLNEEMTQPDSYFGKNAKLSIWSYDGKRSVSPSPLTQCRMDIISGLADVKPSAVLDGARALDRNGATIV
ncbi:hypothetical protein EVAR_5680_1 [Eumeta japonica]|uniref:Uncharacterized protein n=1 Tax=Eumeta variegata TaxID=151549 RepID=A0A4C1T774_EUMVA|nr:hypothetical protein EVAR_5680_1 [Eumeta japonica]